MIRPQGTNIAAFSPGPAPCCGAWPRLRCGAPRELVVADIHNRRPTGRLKKHRCAGDTHHVQEQSTLALSLSLAKGNKVERKWCSRRSIEHLGRALFGAGHPNRRCARPGPAAAGCGPVVLEDLHGRARSRPSGGLGNQYLPHHVCISGCGEEEHQR